MDSSNEEPEPLTFVADRMVILRSAHKLIKEFGMDCDVADLLDVAGWLAGDTLPIVSEATPFTLDDDENETESEDGTGA